MTSPKNIFAIIGSASNNSANEKLVQYISKVTSPDFSIEIFNDLKSLPHFDPELSAANPPDEIVSLRTKIQNADGIIICTPEYVFSIPSGLKNAIEWCVATTVFSEKPAGLITASADGQKGHEELQLILKTVMARFNADTTLLIHGIKGKINTEGEITDLKTSEKVATWIKAFQELLSTY